MGTIRWELDPNDPAGKDDLVSKGELHLIESQGPQSVEIPASKDGIHSLSLHPMRM